MARKEKDGLLSQDHQYACKSHSYLTPPRTPSFEVLGDDDDDSDFLDKDAFLPEQFSLYMSSAFAHSDDTDPFFDFAEDFQDLRQPLLKKDCMWGTAAQIRSSRTSPECSSDSVTTCSMRNMTATPLPLDFRSMTTTPVYFDTSYGSNHFMPISSTVSPSEIENRPKDLISPFRASSNSQVAQLLSPNETESEDEIDVVGVPERSKSYQSNTSMTSSEQVPQTTKEKPKKATTHAINSPPNVSSGLSDSEDSSGSQPRITDPDDTNTSRSRSQTPNVRVSHNDLERKRRDELKRKFDCLRAVIPEIENNERAPKVVILKKASAYVSLLQGQENALRVEKENVRKINGMLMQKLLLMSKRV